MTHRDIFKKFKMLFPNYAVDIEAYYPAGHNALRVRLTNRGDFIFTFNNDRNWRFETANSFAKKGE